MIHILVPVITNRLQYTLDLIFSRMLGLDYQIIPINHYQSAENIPVINYTQLIVSGVFTIPNAGFLKEKDIRSVDTKVKHKQFPQLFSFSVSASSYHIEFDLFSGVFYLVSEYEKYIESHLDQHGRYNQSAYPSDKWQLDQAPLVHLYVEFLWQGLTTFYPKLKGKAKKPKPEDLFTFDIDFPWKYKNKGAKVLWGGLFKDILKGAFQRIPERLKTIFTGKDPNDTYSMIFDHCPREKTLFFFLIDRNSEHDSRFSFENPAYQKLISEIDLNGYEAGIHPSYTASENPGRIKEETQKLAEIVKRPIRTSRQHFLKYQYPSTFRELIEAGIKEDYSLCLFQNGGFPAGMALPFPWYDLEKDESTDLLLVPSIIMDRTLQQYIGLAPEAAVERIKELRTISQEYFGQFTLLFHNDLLSESEEWKGWRQPILNLLKEMS